MLPLFLHIFSKIIREITVAARNGMPDPEMNAALRIAIQAAKAANMGKDTIARAIKRGCGGADGDDFEEIRYEGFGPGGIAVIVEALSDNRNRTVSELRTIFNKCGVIHHSNSMVYDTVCGNLRP